MVQMVRRVELGQLESKEHQGKLDPKERRDVMERL